MKKSAKTRTQKNSRFCIESGCRKEATAKGYCRKHYISNWKHLKFSERIKAEKRLNAYVDRLAQKYPKDYIEKIKEGLENEEKFKETLNELELGSEAAEETEREFLERFERHVKIGE